MFAQSFPAGWALVCLIGVFNLSKLSADAARESKLFRADSTRAENGKAACDRDIDCSYGERWLQEGDRGCLLCLIDLDKLLRRIKYAALRNRPDNFD